MGAATFISRIMGLVREQVFAHLFGAGLAVDAFNIAFRIPNLLRDLFAEGAMSAALVPTFTRVREIRGKTQSWVLAGRVFWTLGGLVSGIAVLGIIFSDSLVGLYAGAFRETPGKFELAVQLTQILFPFFPLVALAAAFMAVLNSLQVFFIPAFASALFNIVSVLIGVLGYWVCQSWGVEPIFGMAVGVVLGGLVQAIGQLPDLRRKRSEDLRSEGFAVLPAPATAWHQDLDLRAMIKLMLPGTVGLAATQVSILVNSILATGAGPGAVSWLNYAFRLMQFPIGVFGVSWSQATLPRVSTQWAKEDYSGAAATLSSSLSQVFAINLPAAVGLAVLAEPLVSVLFEHGQFTANDTIQTARALAAYSVGLAAYSAVKVLVPSFYAFGDTRIPVISSLASVGLTLILNVMSVKWLGFWGLALGTSIAAFLNLTYLLWAAARIVRQRGGVFSIRSVFWRFAVHLGVASGMGVACGLTWAWTGWALGESIGMRAIWLLVLVFEGVIVASLIAWIFGVEESREVSQRLKSLLSRKFGKKTV